MEYSNLFVCLMGIITVFIGLICIIILVSIMSGIVRKTEKAMDKKAAPAPAPAVQPAAGQSTLTGETVAAISAVLAEEMGADVSAIRIKSIKKVQA
ncbi:MAG: OadG family protein [Parasporobacterium sp.]|nr:OadG family protein [Parasporobacterium sp.]